MPGYDSVNPSHMITTGNTTVKTTLEAYRMSMELVKLLIQLIPEPDLDGEMRKEMEKGNVIVDMFDSQDKDAIKKSLSDKGLKEGKDYLIRNYIRPDGEKFTALFYNISDRDKFTDERMRYDPNGAINRENVEIFEAVTAAGINIDRTINMENFEKFCKSKGVNLDYNKPLSKEDKDLAMSLFSSEFTQMSPQQRESIAQKIVASGALNAFYAARASGVVSPETLKNLSFNKESGNTEIMNLNNINLEQVLAIEKRAEANGLRIAVTGPNNGTEYIVSFSAKDQELMQRVFAESNYDLHGKAGDIYKKQLDFEAKYPIQAMETFEYKQYPDGERVKNGSMLVGTKVEPMLDRKGNPIIDQKTNQPVIGRQTIEVNNNRFFMNEEAKKHNMVIQNTFSSGQAAHDIIRNTFGDSKPVLLNPDEAEQYKNATTEKEKLRILQKAQEHGNHEMIQKPILSKEDCEIILKHESMRQLVEKKLQEEYSTGKMSGYIYSISPYEMYMNDQLINGESNQNEREYFRGGNNFSNKAFMETSQFADALSDEDQRYIDDTVKDLSEQQLDFEEASENIEESTNLFMQWNRFNQTLEDGQTADISTVELEETDRGAMDVIEDAETSGLE